jgi:nicotinate-nucleotide--dimethylbenzimidazole phosphoribosyltransferase
MHYSLRFPVSVPPVVIVPALRNALDAKTKPQGALGRIEELALHIGRIQQTTSPALHKPHCVVFAGDHGIADEGVSAYPPEVTAQMVVNFLSGGAAINVFARQNSIALRVVDAGVNHDFAGVAGLVDQKIRKGTRNFLHESAMTTDECKQAMTRGAEIVREIHAAGSNVIMFGEMGIGNTTSASTLMHVLTAHPLETCVGAGTGLSNEQIRHKISIIERALCAFDEIHGIRAFTPLTALTYFGGYEQAMMCGAMLEAAVQKMVIVVDGFIATSALLVACGMISPVKEYCIFAHESGEAGHRTLLNFLGAEPLLRLGMRLGEGTGAVLAYPLLLAAVNILNEMATFESAAVSHSNMDK